MTLKTVARRYAIAFLAPIAERAEDIDFQRAEAARHRAEERISRPMVEMDYERARIALIKALTRLDVSRHFREQP